MFENLSNKFESLSEMQKSWVFALGVTGVATAGIVALGIAYNTHDEPAHVNLPEVTVATNPTMSNSNLLQKNMVISPRLVPERGISLPHMSEPEYLSVGIGSYVGSVVVTYCAIRRKFVKAKVERRRAGDWHNLAQSYYESTRLLPEEDTAIRQLEYVYKLGDPVPNPNEVE